MHLPNGAQIFIEQMRSSTNIEITSISNAAEPVLTLKDGNAAGISPGDFLIFDNSTWSKLRDRVVVIKSVTPGGDTKAQATLTVVGVDTTSKLNYPGTGASVASVIRNWIEIPCVQELGRDGGEQQFYNYQCLSDDQEQQIPTFKSAVSLSYTFAHEFDNPIYPILRKLDETGETVAMRMYVPKAKEMRMWAGVISFNEIPNTNMNEMETVEINVSLKGRFTFVPSDIGQTSAKAGILSESE